MIRIALVGNYSEDVVAHRAIPLALGALEAVGHWLPTETLAAGADETLDAFDGIWCVPGSPYVSAEGALNAIGFARRSGRPFLGTCGGFQHALLEWARTNWDIARPAHAESDPDAADAVIVPLECALVGVSSALHLVPGTKLAAAYGTDGTVEEYQCRFGLAPGYAQRLESGPLKVAARDEAGDVRGIELDGHPFFVATLFQPERAALKGRRAPLAEALVAAARERAWRK